MTIRSFLLFLSLATLALLSGCASGGTQSGPAQQRAYADIQKEMTVFEIHRPLSHNVQEAENALKMPGMNAGLSGLE